MFTPSFQLFHSSFIGSGNMPLSLRPIVRSFTGSEGPRKDSVLGSSDPGGMMVHDRDDDCEVQHEVQREVQSSRRSDMTRERSFTDPTSRVLEKEGEE
jgi:hypothetical protein